MAFVLKKMYKTILKRVLGKYLTDELDVDQFDVNLIAGSLILNTLDLNIEEMNSILENMKTPFRFTSCMVDHFELKIPSLDGLLSEGCNVTVAGVEANLILFEDDQDDNLEKTNAKRENTNSVTSKDDNNNNNNNSDGNNNNNVTSTGEGLADLTALIERIASKINLTITDVHIEIHIPKVCHSLIIKIPGLYSYDEDAAHFKANVKTSSKSTDNNNSRRKTPPRRTIRFDQFSIYIAEKFTESYNGPRGLLGLGNIPATTYKILKCGNNENDDNNDNNNNTNGGNRTNYFTMTMTEDIVNNQDDNQDNINSSNTTIEGFFKSLSLNIPSKHCLNILLESINNISNAFNSNSSSNSTDNIHDINKDNNNNDSLLSSGDIERKSTEHSLTIRLTILKTYIDLFHKVYAPASNEDSIDRQPIIKCLSITSVNTILEVINKTQAMVYLNNNVAHVENSQSSMTSKFMINSPDIIEYIMGDSHTKQKPFNILSYRSNNEQGQSSNNDTNSFILNYNIDVKGTTMMNLLSEGSAVDINIDLITLNTWLYYISPPAVKINSNDDDDKEKDAMPAVASSSTLIHIPKGCIKLLVCEHGNSEDGEDMEEASAGWIQRKWLDSYFLINVIDLKVALGHQMDHALLTQNCKRFVQHYMMKPNSDKPGDDRIQVSSLPNLDTMLTFHSFTVDKCLRSDVSNNSDKREDNIDTSTAKSMIEACGGKIKVKGSDEESEIMEKLVLPTVCIHPLKTINSLKKMYNEKHKDGCNIYYQTVSNGNNQAFYKSFLHENVNVKSSQYRSYEPESSPKRQSERHTRNYNYSGSTKKSSYDVDKRKKSILIKENKYVNDALSCIEVCLPICQLCLTEQDYALIMLLVEDLLKDNIYSVSSPPNVHRTSNPILNTETTGKHDFSSTDDDDDDDDMNIIDDLAYNKIESALCLQVLRCEVYIKEIDLPVGMVDKEHNKSSTWKVNAELGDELCTYPASSGIPEQNFIKRCIEHMKQRLYHNQCMEYHVTLADFQLIQVDGIYADNEENVKSYMRIGAADITLSEEPYGAHIQDNIDQKLRSKYHNLCSKPVMYGTKWGLNTNKYATHVPFGSLKYGSILFMTIDTVLTEDSDRNKLQDVVVDGDIYGVTFRYGVPSSWLFRVIDIVLNPRKSKNIIYNESSEKAPEFEENVDTEDLIDVFTNVNVRFHETIVDYIPSQVNTRAVVLINNINVSTNIVTSSNETKFQIGIEDLSIMLRKTYLPYHADESTCRILVYNPSIKGNDNYENIHIHNIYSNNDGKQSAKLTVWDVQHLLLDVGYVKVMDLDNLNVILTIRQAEDNGNIKDRSNSVKSDTSEEQKPELPLSNVDITIGVVQLYTCYDSCNKLIETISKWWEEYGASDMFLGKWIKKAHEAPLPIQSDKAVVNNNDGSKINAVANSVVVGEQLVGRKLPPVDLPVDKSKPPVISLLSHINDESAFGGSKDRKSNNNDNISNIPLKTTTSAMSSSSNTKPRKKLVIVDDYYDMNNFKESSTLRQQQGSNRVSSRSITEELESSFEIIDMDDFAPQNVHKVIKDNALIDKINKPDVKLNSLLNSMSLNGQKNTIGTSNITKMEVESDEEDEDEWGDNDNTSKSLMVSWFGGGSNENITSNSPEKNIPMSSILQSPKNKVLVKESTGILNITFDDDVEIPNDILMTALPTSEKVSKTSAITNDHVDKSEEDGDSSGYSETNSDFDDDEDSSDSEESDSELWESAYGNTMNINDTNYVLKQNDGENENKRGTKMVINYVDDNEIAKEENNVRNDEAPYNMANSVENMKTLLTYDKDDNITKNQVKSDKGETPPTNDTLPADIYENEGLQHVKWYKGSHETISDLKPGVNILPHYIPIVPLSSCGEGAINSIKAISDVPESIKLKEQRANDGSSKDHIDSGKTHVVGRVVINKMNLSWKWFDGKDWEQTESNMNNQIFRETHNIKPRRNLFSGEDEDDNANKASANKANSSNKETLLGIILGHDDEGETTDNVAYSRFNNSARQWWVIADHGRELYGSGSKRINNSIHHIPCGRIVETMVEIRLTDFAMRSDAYNQSSPYTSNLIIHIHNFELIDHLLTSNLKKIVSHWRSNKLHPRETNKPMVRLSMLSVKTGKWREQPPSYVPDDEIRMRLGILPLRINLDQDAAYFIANFVTNLGKSGEENIEMDSSKINVEIPPDSGKNDESNDVSPSSGEIEPDMYFQTVTISSVKVKIDYHPKRVDIEGLRQGNYVELINILPMEGLMLLLPKMELLSLKGIDNVGAKIGDIWGKEIVEKQLHHLAAGINVPPIRSLANVCNGACDVVLLPLKQYQEGGHISSSLRTSTSNFVHTLSLEALTNASRLAATTQTILESAHDYLASSSSKHGSKKGFVTTNSKRSKNNRKRRNSRQSYNETFRSAPSVFSDQPANVTEALNQAAQRLSTRFNSSQRTVVAVPIGKYKEKGIGGTVRNVVKAMPVAILGPMIGGAEALSRVILGARNSLDPDLKFDQNEKYKSTRDMKRGGLKKK